MKKTIVKTIFAADSKSDCARPLYTAKVSAGFPSPAENYIEGQLDLNKYLIRHPAATYFVRVDGDSMINAGIHNDDLLIVDRAERAKDGDVVIATIDGELTVKRIGIKNGRIRLVPENPKYKVQDIAPDMEFEVWGVVKHVVHSL